ncbi:UNVERIFIED_CONTAM: hypothetical protein FKN15_031635 [Acipenser sinensis]
MYRQQHGAPPLRLSAQLSREAQKWASQLLSMRALQHSDTDHGENIWCRTSSVRMPVSGKEVVEAWYKEIKDYDFNRPGFQKNSGHFSQVVWRDSRELGIALATDSGLAIAVARYEPRGNITNPGYFQKNVLPKGALPPGRDPDLQCKSQTQTVRVMVNKPETVRVTGACSSSSVRDRESEQFSRDLLKKLNDKRQQHGAGPLRISPALSKEAKDWAEHLIQKRVIQNHPGDHGQSLWYQTGTSTENPSEPDSQNCVRYTEPDSQNCVRYTEPDSQNCVRYTEPDSQNCVRYTEPDSQNCVRYTEPDSQNCVRYTEPDSQNCVRYTEPDSQNCVRYTEPDSQNCVRYTEPDSQNCVRYTEPDSQNCVRYTEPDSQNCVRYTEPDSQNCVRYTEPDSQNCVRYTEPDSQNCVKYTEQD